MKKRDLEKLKVNSKKNLKKILRAFIKSLDDIDESKIKINPSYCLIRNIKGDILPIHISVCGNNLDLYINENDLFPRFGR
jgi:hypothetical protein